MKKTVDKVKIAFFTSNLDVGGIQRSIVALLQNLDPQQYKVDLFLLKNGGALRHLIPEYVQVKQLKRLPRIAKFIPFGVTSILFARQYATSVQYDVAIDYDGYQPATALAALTANAKRHVGWVHGNYAERIHSDRRFKLLFYATRGKYRRFTAIVTVSEGLVDDMSKMARVPSHRITVVNNLIDITAMADKSKESPNITFDATKYNLVSVCRLIKQKGVDQTLDVFYKAVRQNEKIHLYIVGDGPERDALEVMVSELGIGDNVTFLGQLSNPYPIMKHADGYISTSWHEGQGISTLEAKYFGLDIFIPKRLEKYSYNVQGSDDLSRALAEASRDIDVRRADKGVDTLESYNTNVLRSFDEVISPHG